MDQERFVITISHQLGSGGAYVGQKLSECLGVPFIDREILKRVAGQLHLAEAELTHREERVRSFWQRFSQLVALTDPTTSLAADRYVPTDRELFQLESETIQRIADQSSAIFIGRGGRCILQHHPRHLSVLVHAALPARVRRLCELYHLSESEAEKLAVTNDRERTAYLRAFTQQDWLDPRLYDLCISTSSLGLDTAVELVLTALAAKLR